MIISFFILFSFYRITLGCVDPIDRPLTKKTRFEFVAFRRAMPTSGERLRHARGTLQLGDTLWHFPNLVRLNPFLLRTCFDGLCIDLS
jgi:hypothetical protein